MATEKIMEYGERLLPHLVQAAKTSKTPTYGELAQKIGVHHRVLSHILGYIRDEIIIPRELPLINAIVVNGDTGLPGESWLPEGTSHLNKEEYKKEYLRYRYQVLAFKGWDTLLKELDIEPVEPTVDSLDDRGRAYSEYLKQSEIIYDDEDHLRLKEFVSQHPEAINLEPGNEPLEEINFISGDKADIIFGIGPNAWAVVEIKSDDIGDLVIGVYQLVKYRALLQAEKGHGSPIQVDTYLVAYEIPHEIKFFALKLGVFCRKIPRKNII